MSNFLRVKSVGIYYTAGKTNPSNIEATYQRVGEDIKGDIHFAEFVPEEDVFLDEYVDRQEGVINITPNQIVREVTGLQEFITKFLTNERILTIGAAYESKLTTRSNIFNKERV